MTSCAPEIEETVAQIVVQTVTQPVGLFLIIAHDFMTCASNFDGYEAEPVKLSFIFWVTEPVQRPFANCTNTEWVCVTILVHFDAGPTDHGCIICTKFGRWEMECNIRVALGNEGTCEAA